jgi:hypothetical protein
MMADCFTFSTIRPPSSASATWFAIAFRLRHNGGTRVGLRRACGPGAQQARDLEMPGVDTAMGTFTVPIWVAGAASAVFVVALIVAFGKAGTVALATTLLRAALVLVGVFGVYIYLQRSALQHRIDERRTLDERSAALMGRAIAPGSALSCLDELAGELVEAACEKAVFASPEAVAAAVAYVAAQLALLTDGTQHAERVDKSYAADLAPLRAALELDRFGIVAHVLAQREGCSADKCDGLSRFEDASHVLANLRDGTFDEQVTKYTASWISSPQPPDGPAIAAVAQPPAAPSIALPPVVAPATAPAVPTIPTPAPASVAPRYDFPSSQSIPPINIMAPEPPAPRGAATAVPADANGQAGGTPVPPRRPPQTRTAPGAPRPAALRPEQPAADPALSPVR